MIRNCEGLQRRDFLQIGSAGLLGLTLPGLLASEAKAKSRGSDTKAKSVILVWLAGGPATIDMWDNKPEAPEGIRGEFKSLKSKVGGLQMSEVFPKLNAIADKISVVRSLYHTIPSHFTATVWMTTGNKPLASTQYPSMGSLSAKLLKTELGVPPYVTFQDLRGGLAGGAGYLGTSYNPFTVEAGGAGGKDKASFRVRGITLPNNFSLSDLDKRDDLLNTFDDSFRALDRRNDLVEGLDTFHKQALEILRSDKTRNAFNLGDENAKVKESYGSTPFATSAIAARRLVEAGVRFVTIGIGGWDTHNNNFKSLKETRVPPLDQTLSALIADLDNRGLLDSTIVMCAGEFGRTPKINKNAGRDHWSRSMACVLAGGREHLP